MRRAEVYMHEELAGILTEESQDSYHFEYDPLYFANPEKPAISLTLPKTKTRYQADSMFPFFYNMIAEGANLHLQERLLKMDKEDIFGLLVNTAGADTIGAVTVKEIES